MQPGREQRAHPLDHLAHDLAHGLGLAARAVRLVLGVRNLSQQGMFLIGGTLADRYGYRLMILTGCVMRTVAFGLPAVTSSLPAPIGASALTGPAEALFNPAVRAYLAADAGQERGVEAFAAFNVFYQAGILVGPLAGLTLPAWDFGAAYSVAALISPVRDSSGNRTAPGTWRRSRSSCRDEVICCGRATRARPRSLNRPRSRGCRAAPAVGARRGRGPAPGVRRRGCRRARR